MKSVSRNPDGEVHVVSGLVEGEGNDALRIGFEDLPNTGDADYNDVVFDLTVMPQYSGMASAIDGDDILKGGHGDDILMGGGGDDLLYGGRGADTFRFESDQDGINTVKDFRQHQGDSLDISDVLTEEFDPVEDMLSHFVDIDNNGVLKVDADGQGTAHDMTAIAIIKGGQNLDAQELYDNGQMVI